MDTSNLLQIAKQLRQSIIEMIAAAGSGHPGGALGLADIFTVIYFANLFNLNPDAPNDPNRDRVIVSNGHVCPVWYAALSQKGYFPPSELATLRQFGSRLQGHPHKDFSSIKNNQTPTTNLPGVENTAGPLGQGISFAAGLSLGLRHLSNPAKVICIVSDGELNEGQSWEGFMFANKYRLNNLTFIIDRNNIQIDGFTKDIMPLKPIKDKLAAFGLDIISIDGHNLDSITKALTHQSTKTKVIIAKTIPGKGVPFMENKFEWHGKAPDKQQAQEALRSIQA
jgi:transketolase